MEAPGVEPGSEGDSQSSIYARSRWSFSPAGCSSAITLAGQPTAVSAPHPLARYSAQPDCLSVLTATGGSLHTVVAWLRGESNGVVVRLCDVPVFAWPRAPRRAARPSSSPSKPFRPHVKEQLVTVTLNRLWVNSEIGSWESCELGTQSPVATTKTQLGTLRFRRLWIATFVRLGLLAFTAKAPLVREDEAKPPQSCPQRSQEHDDGAPIQTTVQCHGTCRVISCGYGPSWPLHGLVASPTG